VAKWKEEVNESFGRAGLKGVWGDLDELEQGQHDNEGMSSGLALACLHTD